ncbi:strucutural protein [Synechococcus phage S-RSM4]|uniref:Strucutural protein n=2 Tax=root TaxID=1 RepID=C7BVB9_9CAUD|nr:virion structural protein [Synechococcus phage S-RSM4]CAR63348.1 strucutural protein [Synechococcus phage S-RSM4]
MAAVKTKRISTLIESQLPQFISTEYELFSKFVQKYYEAQEVQGGTLDVINNLQKYLDIDFYEKNLLKQNDTLAVSISDTDTTIVVNDASSFPTKNGYIRINDEIIFYSDRTDTEFRDCSRGVSGNTTLGDLYTASNFKSTEAASHNANSKVYNVSNLFLYAFVKNFESQYLGSFPEKYLRGEVDKRTLIKNINKFYKSKGTDSSIKFIFNTIVSQDVTNKPEVYKPKDFTYKASKSDWINVYALKVKVISGDPTDLIGKQIVQPETEEYGYVSATVDNARAEGTFDGEKIWNIVLAPETVTGEFAISTKTRLEKNISQADSVGKRINVFSTIGWGKTGEVLIGEETIKFDDKNVTQFTISKRGSITYNHEAGASVYKPVVISSSNVKLLTLGVVYNFEINDSHPYSAVDDTIEISNPGFESADPKIVNTGSNQTRWILNRNLPINAPTVPYVGTQLGQTSTDVSAIFADDQYYYITSSGYPSYKILDGSSVSQTVEDQKLLRIIRRLATRTTEKYKTPKTEVGILLNGVRLYGYKDTDSIRYGTLEQIVPDRQGSGYVKPPFVLLDGAPNKARAVLSGSVVERYIVDTNNIFPRTPVVEVTSGRGASVRAVVTGDKITSMVIENPGEYYSSPPIVRITDSNGKGRFAEYNAIVDTDGRLVDFEKIAEGNFYDQRTVKVDIIAVGNGAIGTPLLKEWNFNRYEKLKSVLDTENGYLFPNYNITFENGYGQVANPKALRVALNDNLSAAGLEPSTKTHSPILGFAYDGNPIYGPFAHQNPLDSQSPIVRMTSSYVRNSSRSGGPSVSEYPLGTFTNDYTYKHKNGSLDENNGRFCITPEFPEGVYAYFLTIDSNQVPQYPYILGENFYSLPVDSNYNSDINQNDIPKASKRLFTPGMQGNGSGVFAKINEVKPGTVDNITIENSSSNFSVNSKVYFDNKGTNGSEAEALVNSVKGKPVSYIDSYENKVVKLTTIQNAYLFTDDILRQPSSNASGQIVGNVRNDNEIVLKNVVGTFDNTGTFSADIKTFFILLDQDSSYSEGAILSLTDGINPTVAKGEVLNGTSNQNVVEIKVVPLNPEDDPQDWDLGDWFQFNQGEYFLQSNNFFNTSGTRPVTLTSLSDNLEPFEVNQSVALVETVGNHGLGIDDKVDITILPDDSTKTKTYYLRKRLYQNVVFKAPEYSSTISDTGVGRFQILNGGADYAPGTYTNVPLTGGSGTGATSIVVVSDAGVVSSISIQDKGTGYRKADYLGIDDESLSRSVASQSTQRLTLYVDHVGFAAGSTRLNVSSTNGLAEGDTVLIGEEVIEIASISGNTLTVLRGREGTVDKDHYDKQPVDIYKPKLNFIDNFQLGAGNSAYIASYNPSTQEATLVYDYQVELNTAVSVTISTSFFDSSVPSRLVAIQSLEPIAYKFEFSEDNVNFTPNPNIDIQELYRYVFDTSHPSLTGTYFDLSPSKNFNLITGEKLASNTLPGNAGAFTEVKFGFGSRIAANDYSTEKGTDFTNFYYFDKNGIVNAEGSFLKIVKDPLQGEKRVIYVTPNRFVYNVSSEPLWDGSGDISYTTTGQFAIGEIKDFKITNLGLNYKKVPIITGVAPTQNYRASATVLFDLESKVITSVEVNERGSNYSNPKVVITDGDGIDAKFNVVLRGGEIFSITVANPGSGYTYAPTIEIVESDVEAYVDSNTIGIPQSVSIIRNGGAFHLDKTVASNFTSKYTLALLSPEGRFRKGETVVQKVGATEVMRAKVAEWRQGTNLLKLESVTGIVRENLEVQGIISKSTGTVKAIYATTFKEKITSFFDNIGYYSSDRGKLGVSNQKITDSFFYQDYSYVVKSKTPIDQWRELIKSTTHPAGFKLFGQVDIETDAPVEMPAEAPKASHFTVIQLWDPNKNKITVENTRRTITQTVQKIENQRIKKGVGSAATSEFNFNESRAFTVTLSAPFDGYFDDDGRLQGTTTFQLLNDGALFSPASAKNLVITLNGVLQEPEVAYTVSGDTITFAAPPLGPGQKLTGNNLSELSDYSGTIFYGRYFAFKDNQYNTRYFKKLRNIFQRNGRWLDSANQIERNRTFIVEETIGYGREKYPSLDWSTKQDDYERDLGYILDAYEHDVRFGGNVKTVDYINLFGQDSDYDYITKNKTASLDIFKYATNLANLAIRNWDIVETGVSYIQGSTTMIVADTNRLATGMHVSSGRAYPEGTKIVSIDSDTEITLSRAALSNSGGGGGAPEGTTSYSGTSGGNNIIAPTNTAVVEPGDTFAIEPGDTFIAPTSFSGSDTATFFFSGINSGTFYDAANLIEANKEYIQNEVSNLTFDNFVLHPNTSQEKCKRDIGYLVDAMVYHLRLGGNEKVVEFARFYFTNAGYPYGEELTYLGVYLPKELIAARYAWNLVGTYAKEAMRNSLNAPIYPDSPDPVEDLTISVDTQFPYCAEVASAIDSMIDIVNDIIDNGTGAVDPTPINASKPGNWTDTKPYTDYNLIPDSDLPYNGECDDVVSAVNSLYDAVDGILNSSVVARTLPDYVDGENKIFEMYWEDGSEVNTEEDEDLFLTINAVLQRPKYNADYPGEDSYYIDRTTIPNKLVFDVAPIWDQDFGAKSIGEPTAVEKVVGIGVGNYKRLTIDKNLVNGERTGPFLILDVEDLTVQSIEDKEFLYVFLDGVLQREGYSYTVAGPNIYFNVPIKDEMKIDMRYLYGRDVGQTLNLYDFAPDQFYAKASVVLQIPSGVGAFSTYAWMGDKIGSPIHAWQVRPDGSRNILGQLSNIAPYATELAFAIFGFKCELDTSLPVTFAVSSDYSRNTSLIITDYTITYETDEFDRALLSSNDQIWSGTFLGKTYRNPFLSLSSGDSIRVEGEDSFRKIKRLPSTTLSKEQRFQQQVSNSLTGSVDVERYNGITRGEGLSVVAIIENGSVVRLEWNRRSYEPLTQPTAYQYYTPPVLHFIPLDGNGGGARANVLVSKGQVISVDLIDGGSGYTKAPKVEVARKYDILSDRDIGVSLINVGISPLVEVRGLVSQSTIDIINLPPPLAFTTTAVVADSPKRVDIDLEEEIQLLRAVSEELTASISEIRSNRPNPDKFVVIDMFTATNQYLSQVSGRVGNIISSSVVTASRQITSTVHNIIQNNSLSNINYYEVAAFLDVDADPTDTIIYIADTSKFKTNGFLLIGDEVVRYMRKLSDRFLMVQRGQEGTVAKFWPAGTFIRQIPDPVSVVPGGVLSFTSEASVSMVGAASGIGEGQTGQDRVRYEQVQSPDVTLSTASRQITAEVQPELNINSISSVDSKVLYKLQSPFNITPVVTVQETTTSVNCEIQTVHSDFNTRKEALEVVLIPPPSGVIDGYQESVFITDPVSTRLNGFVNIDDDYGVVQRDGTIIFVINSVFGVSSEYIGNYTTTNAGHTISHFDGIFDDGSCNVSGLSILELDTYYPALTIRDFSERATSSYTISGSKFTLLPPSIQNPVSISSSTGTIGTSISVQSTTYFPDFGYIFTSGGTVFQYTSKTATTFEGCTLYTGPDSINAGEELVPYSID